MLNVLHKRSTPNMCSLSILWIVYNYGFPRVDKKKSWFEGCAIHQKPPCICAFLALSLKLNFFLQMYWKTLYNHFFLECWNIPHSCNSLYFLGLLQKFMVKHNSCLKTLYLTILNTYSVLYLSFSITFLFPGFTLTQCLHCHLTPYVYSWVCRQLKLQQVSLLSYLLLNVLFLM